MLDSILLVTGSLMRVHTPLAVYQTYFVWLSQARKQYKQTLLSNNCYKFCCWNKDPIYLFKFGIRIDSILSIGYLCHKLVLTILWSNDTFHIFVGNNILLILLFFVVNSLLQYISIFKFKKNLKLLDSYTFGYCLLLYCREVLFFYTNTTKQFDPKWWSPKSSHGGRGAFFVDPS